MRSTWRRASRTCRCIGRRRDRGRRRAVAGALAARRAGPCGTGVHRRGCDARRGGSRNRSAATSAARSRTANGSCPTERPTRRRTSGSPAPAHSAMWGSRARFGSRDTAASSTRPSRIRASTWAATSGTLYLDVSGTTQQGDPVDESGVPFADLTLGEGVGVDGGPAIRGCRSDPHRRGCGRIRHLRVRRTARPAHSPARRWSQHARCPSRRGAQIAPTPATDVADLDRRCRGSGDPSRPSPCSWCADDAVD